VVISVVKKSPDGGAVEVLLLELEQLEEQLDENELEQLELEQLLELHPASYW
jgi:hypothetical protein